MYITRDNGVCALQTVQCGSGRINKEPKQLSRAYNDTRTHLIINFDQNKRINGAIFPDFSTVQIHSGGKMLASKTAKQGGPRNRGARNRGSDCTYTFHICDPKFAPRPTIPNERRC